MKFPLSSYLSQFPYYVLFLIYIYILEKSGVHVCDSKGLHNITNNAIKVANSFQIYSNTHRIDYKAN